MTPRTPHFSSWTTSPRSRPLCPKAGTATPCSVADVRANGGTIAYERIGFTEADWDAIPASNKSFAPLADGSIPSSRYIRSRILIHHLVYLEVGS